MFFLDAADCKYPELIKELEQLTDQDFLNTYMPVQTGSGFLIDLEGYVLTNRHVVIFKDLNDVQENFGTEIAESLLKEYDYNFTDLEKAWILQDFQTMFSNAKYRFTGILADQEYEIEVLEVADEDSDDLALIRLKGEAGFSAIPLADSNDISSSLIGETVYSFGYPLGATITQIFQDRIVSMNKGNISAFRDDELSIQHNAAISKGNSGGPLVNENKKVVGINTAEIESGNSLYYSIGTDRVAAFLNERGYSDILKWNYRILIPENNKINVKTNPLGEFESSSDLLVLGEDGARIYLDKYLLGTTPMYVSLQNPLSEIRIVGAEGEFSARIRKLSSLSGTTELIPEYEKKLVSLDISESTGKSVGVYADGRFLGNTPLLTELPGDIYDLSFKSDSSVHPDINLDLTKERLKEIVLQGEPGYQIRVLNFPMLPDSDGTDINQNLILGKSTTRQSGSFLFHSNDTDMEIQAGFADSIVLSKGSWTLEIQGIPEWEGRITEFEVNGETSVDLYKSGGSGSLTIRNFQKNMEVYVDGNKIETPSEIIPLLPLGLRDVYIWKDGNLPYEIDITVRNDNSAFVTFQSETAHSTKGWIWGAGSLLVAGAGVSLGLIDTDPYALSHSSNYDEYVDVKTDIARMSGGLILTGTAMLISAIAEWVAHDKVKKHYREVLGEVQ